MLRTKEDTMSTKTKSESENELQLILRRIVERSKPLQPSPYRELHVSAHQPSARMAVR
jgi:hypothetical protein